MAYGQVGTSFEAPATSSLNISLNDSSGNAILASCTSTPPTTANVFAHGCLIIQSDSGTGANSVYQNTGSIAVPAWSLLDTGTSFTLPTTSTDAATTTTTSFNLAMSAITSGSGMVVAVNAMTSGKAVSVTSTSAVITSGNVVNVSLTSSGTLAAKTGATFNVAESMTHTADADVTQNFNSASIARTVVRATGGADTHTTLSQGSLLSLANTITATSGTITDTVIGLKVVMSSSGTGAGISVTHAATGGIALNVAGAATSVDDVLISGSGVKASGKGSLRVTNSGATAAGGAVLYVSATGTPAAATSYLAAFDNSGMTATNNPAAVFISQVGTGPAMVITAAVQTTHFYKMFQRTSGSVLWWGDGTTANGALSGSAGDMLINGGSGKPEYCTGTTSWTALV